MPSRPSRLIPVLLVVITTSLALAGCGRRGSLEDPSAVKPKSTGGLIPSTEAPAKPAAQTGKQVATPGATITPSNRSFPLDSIL